MVPKDMSDVIDQRLRPTGVLRVLPGAARRARWWIAAMLWLAVLAELELARQAAPVKVFGPGGKFKIMPRARAEQLLARHKIQRAPEDEVREALGMPPRITMDAASDHTAGAGADGFDGIDRTTHAQE